MYKIIPVKPFDLVLFGATGDLAKREIIPGLYRRFKVGQMPQSSRIIGAKEFVGFLQGERSLDDAIAQTVISTRQYAKRQMTWFKGRMKNWNWVGAAD